MEIYISYSWAPPIKAIMSNWLCPILNANHVDYIIDEKDCGYGHDIVKFEKEIGKADNVLIMASESYFTSINCMYEMALIMKYTSMRKTRLWVSADDFNRDENEYDAIFDRWDKELARLKEKLTGDVNRDRYYKEKIEKIELILQYFPDAWQQIMNKNTLSFEKISQNNFQELLEYIKKEVLLAEPNSDLPMDVGDAPRGTTIIQNGNNCVAATISNGGAMTINM